MESKNAVWMILAVGFVAIFLFASVAAGENSARIGRISAQDGGQQFAAPAPFPSPSGGAALAAPSQPSGASCGGGSGGGCGCGGGGNQPSVVPAPDSNVAQTGVTKSFSLGTIGSSYDPAAITVSQGDTVKLEGDMGRLRGCDRSFVIPGYGIRKTFKEGDNVLQFVADKKGTFPYSCSMGMYRGTLIVQ